MIILINLYRLVENAILDCIDNLQSSFHLSPYRVRNKLLETSSLLSLDDSFKDLKIKGLYYIKYYDDNLCKNLEEMIPCLGIL